LTATPSTAGASACAAKEHKDEARRAARIWETAVGEALGEATDKGGRGNKASATKDGLSRDESWRYRLMAAHRDMWWPVLAERALSRNQVLTMIAEANRPRVIGPGEARMSLGYCLPA
jgi:hypothetical protein